MPDQDVPVSDVVKGLVAEQEKLQRLAAEATKVSVEFPAKVDDNKAIDDSWYNSRIAASIGRQVGEALGEITFSLLRSLVPSPEQIAAARARAAAAAAPPSPPAAIPVPAQATPASPVENKGIDLVGHVDEDRRAPTLPTEPLSGHIERLDLEDDVRDQVREPKLKGPINA